MCRKKAKQIELSRHSQMCQILQLSVTTFYSEASEHPSVHMHSDLIEQEVPFMELFLQEDAGVFAALEEYSF